MSTKSKVQVKMTPARTCVRLPLVHLECTPVHNNSERSTEIAPDLRLLGGRYRTRTCDLSRVKAAL
jgi:hypothetical protein